MSDSERQIISIEWHEHGQTRRYGDSIYEATITFETTVAKWTPPQIYVRKLASVVMNQGEFKMKNEERGWHETYAERFEQLADNKWRIRLVRPYDD